MHLFHHLCLLTDITTLTDRPSTPAKDASPAGASLIPGPVHLPSPELADQEMGKAGPQHFLWICLQDQVISAAHKGSQEAALPPTTAGPVLTSPARGSGT